MKRRELFKFLAATPAAFLVAKYGAPEAARDLITHYDPSKVVISWNGIPFGEGLAAGDLLFTAKQTMIKGDHVSLNADGELTLSTMKALAPAGVYEYEDR